MAGTGGLNVQGENLLLPAPSFSGVKKATEKQACGQDHPLPPLITPITKMKKTNRRKKGRGGVYRYDRRKIQTEGRKTCRQINTFFSPETHYNQKQIPVSERKGGGFAFLFFSSWVNLSVGDQQVWFAK